MKTFSAKANEVEKSWYVIDASNKVLGRLATTIASRLKGKHKPEYTPHVDTGDYIVVINAERLRVTGNKLTQKKYYTHTGRPGSLKSKSLEFMHQTQPARVIELAVKGMLPKNSLGRAMLRKLHVYSGPDHRHHAQKPKILDIT